MDFYTRNDNRNLGLIFYKKKTVAEADLRHVMGSTKNPAS